MVSAHGQPLNRLVISSQRPAGGVRGRYRAHVDLTLVDPRVARARCLSEPNEREVLSDPLAKLVVHGIAYPSGQYLEYAEVFRLCSPGGGSPRFDEDVSESTFSFMGSEGTRTELYVLAGPYLAWQLRTTDRYFEGEDWIDAVDVLTGRRHGIFIGRQQNGDERASQIVLTATGHIAWIRDLQTVEGREPSRTYAVEAAVLHNQASVEGDDQVIYLEGSKLASLSGLHFDAGGVLHWLNGGTPHSFTFPS
jgi:hypothetical protein